MAGEEIAVQEQQLVEVEQSLAKLPLSMAKFSSMTRSLYGVNQVTGEDKGSKTFLEVREDVRRNAAIYKDKVLPLTEEVVRHIGFFADSFLDFDFNDWTEALEDTIGDIDKAIGFCMILRQMHLSISEELKRNQDKAEVGIQMMDKMASEYQRMSEGLERDARLCKESAEAKHFWGNVTGALTLGISTIVLHSVAQQDEQEANEKMGKAVAKRENAEVAHRAAHITSTSLIPAIREFIEGMDTCSAFLVNTKENLEKLKNYGDKGAKQIYFKAMKKKAQELSSNSMRFLTMTDMIRSDIAAIPEEVSDKNYVDEWFELQKEKFRTEHKSIWALIAGATIGKSGQFHFFNVERIWYSPTMLVSGLTFQG